MNCWHCEEEVEWEEDIDLPDADWEFVTNLRCTVCEAYYQVFLPRGGAYEYEYEYTVEYEEVATVLNLVPKLEKAAGKKAPDEEPGE
jgi:hypothetical protein